MGLKNTAVLAVILGLALAGVERAIAATTITAVTGGSAISATNAGSSWTTLTGPVLTESTSGAIGGGTGGQTGTIIFTAPSGFAFNTSATVTVKVNGGSTASRNINDLANNSTIPVTVASNTLTATITAASSGSFNANTLTWQNIQVRPTAGTPLASGALTESGTCTFQGLTGSWGTLTEVSGPVARLAFTTEPAGATAGTALVAQPVVSSRDQFGNNSTNGLPANSFVAVTLTGGTGPLQGTTSLNLGLSGGKGTAAFTNLRIDAAGNNKQLTVTSTNGLTSDVSSVFTVSPAVASKLVMSTQPAVTAVAGVRFVQQPVVLIQDAFNNLRSSDTLVVIATRSAGAGALLGTTNIAAVGGVATFTNLAHPYTTNITLAFTSGSLTATTSSLIAVNPGPFSQPQLLLPGETLAPATPTGKTGTPTAQTAGTPFSGRVNAVDAYWNTANTNVAVVGLTCSDTTTALPASVALVNGTNSFSVTMKVAATQTVTATYSTMNATSAPVVVNAGTAVKLLVLMPGETPAPETPAGKTGTPTAQTAGMPFSVTVNAVDTNWNLTASTHTIAITASDTNAALPSNAALSGGTGSFSVTLKTAGSWSVTATDTSAGPLSSNTGSPTTATPGAFAKLQVLMPGETGAPGSASGKAGVAAGQTAGTPFAVVVSAVDANWNSISTNHTVHLTSSDTNAVLPADTALVSGTKAMSVTLNTAGARTVAASDVTQGGITANTSTAITVSPGPFAKLQLLMPGETAAAGTTNGKTGSPGAQTVGTAFNLTVNAVDAQWNVLNTNHTVAITSSDSNATLPTNAVLVGGTRTFSLTFRTAGSQTATATDVTDGTKSPATSPLTQVNAGAFAKLQLLVPGETSAPGTTTGKSGAPFNQISNIAFTVTVSGVDANWNVVDTNDTIRFTSSDNRAVLPTNAPLVAGTRNFSVTLMTIGASTLTVSNVTHTGITANTSSAITVVAQGYVTNSLNFTNATRQALLADGWSFIATLPGGGPRNTEITNSADGALVSYDQVAHPGPCCGSPPIQETYGAPPTAPETACSIISPPTG